MKKIIALILAVSCVFALASCKFFKKDKGEGNKNVDREAVATVQAKLDASSPETANITVDLDAELGELKGSYMVTYDMENGNASVEYTYEQFGEIAADGSFKQTFEGSVLVSKDGTLSEEIDGVGAVEALTFDINLDADKLESATFNAGMLTVKVKAENTKSVIGVAIAAEVEVMITVSETGIASVTIAYNSAAGAIEIVATYTYYVAPEEDEEGAEEGATE